MSWVQTDTFVRAGTKAAVAEAQAVAVWAGLAGKGGKAPESEARYMLTSAGGNRSLNASSTQPGTFTTW
ncbi:hypothetical protein HYQ46_002936 [Verticillium longisporum]|nr:hypothetical protein HYQ46_002936 [Verticillium longisporum]